MWVRKGPSVCTCGWPDTFHFENLSCALCVRLEMHLRGDTRFMEVGSSSSFGWNPVWVCVVLCHVMLCHGGKAHICTAAWSLGLEKGHLRSASGFYWLILKANEIQEQVARDEKHFWSLSSFSSNKLHISRSGPETNKQILEIGTVRSWNSARCHFLIYALVVLSSVLWNPPGVKPCILWKPKLAKT